MIHAEESAVKQHPAYAKAKAGDDEAATVLVLDTFNMQSALTLRSFAGDVAPTLVSAHALERDGVNAIPEVFAERLSQVLGWPAETGVVQTNVVSHTGANGFWRMARQAEFDGPVQAGDAYVLVDDFVGMGGTLAN